MQPWRVSESVFICGASIMIFERILVIGVLGLLGTGVVQAADVTLKIHHFLPTTSTTHARFIVPWAEKIIADSKGRIAFDVYPAMQLGGRPPQLYDQARDGVADIVWTLPGYTAGRFPLIGVFELPFMISSAEATSQAAWEYYKQYAQDEFKDVYPLLVHVHARGVLHTRTGPIASLEDLHRLKIRAPSRTITAALRLLGATPIGMPATQAPQALAKGVIDGAVLPYEVIVPLKIHELTAYHTQIEGPRGLYTAVFLFAMNKARYDSLPPDLQKIIDANSGLKLAKKIGRVWDRAEREARDFIAAKGNTITTLTPAETERWRETTEPVIDRWVMNRDNEGQDGRRLLEAARGLIDKYSR